MTVVLSLVTNCSFCIYVQVQAETYKLGLSLAITGPTSDAGDPYSKGVEDYFKYVNDMKLLGMTKSIAPSGTTSTRPMSPNGILKISGQGIVFYLNYSTGSTLALKKDFDEEKMPTIPASFHAGNLDGLQLHLSAHRLLFGPGHRAGRICGQQPQRAGHPKVAMFIHPSAFGRGPYEDVEKAVKPPASRSKSSKWSNMARTWTTPPC
jgi:branched-chain amino acid transport system substrate-binding protein